MWILDQKDPGVGPRPADVSPADQDPPMDAGWGKVDALRGGLTSGKSNFQLSILSINLRLSLQIVTFSFNIREEIIYDWTGLDWTIVNTETLCCDGTENWGLRSHLLIPGSTQQPQHRRHLRELHGRCRRGRQHQWADPEADAVPGDWSDPD